MKKTNFILKEAPKYDLVQFVANSRGYPGMDPELVVSSLTIFSQASELLGALEEQFAGYGISYGRFCVLMMLVAEPEKNFSPSEIAEQFKVTKATVTGLVDGLEKDGLIRREDHPHDRRVWIIKITAEGEEVVDRVMPQLIKWYAHLMKNLTAAERSNLISLLAKVELSLSDKVIE
jgi:DNA-binding MarR family transcriptional regulator